MLQTLAVANYRSIRSLVVPLGRLNLITGPNGSGKSNLYRALRLLAEAACGGVVGALAREGGLSSTLWAGPEHVSERMRRGEVPVQGVVRQEPVNLKLGFAGEDFGYAMDLGFPPPPTAPAFALDPEFKREAIWSGLFLRSSNVLIDRRGPLARVRDGRAWRVVSDHLSGFESLLTQVADPERAPEAIRVREAIRAWRFYDHFRSDRDAPARQAQLGTRTVVMGHDGADLAAAWETIKEIGNPEALHAAVEDAFPGAKVSISIGDGGRFTLMFSQHDLLRPLSAMELSDGTLRYLLLIAALHTPRPPPLMVLNEPETSLHPDLLPALARLIIHASSRSQVWVVSHAPRLIAALEAAPDCQTIALEKDFSQTRIVGQRPLDEPAWYWPER
ncbi:AAA family ATPase [Rhodanobacter sp. DHG33]|uniref:AAA family ATPase n=1 Tax=Rhodanobacter sp. DHG33 TaxID=2775921 RepID=UPI001782438C|nr:AAA family ATPase [Rhodanobacter sp. DHG33]MBD8898979.1 AAA family ATPase [Rhodanobacter sp. DHG33]